MFLQQCGLDIERESKRRYVGEIGFQEGIFVLFQRAKVNAMLNAHVSLRPHMSRAALAPYKETGGRARGDPLSVTRYTHLVAEGEVVGSY